MSQATQQIHAKKRLKAMRAQVVGSTIAVPTLMTMAEAALALRISRPKLMRLVRRGDVKAYRPTGAGGVILVHADSVADHIARHSYGGAY